MQGSRHCEKEKGVSSSKSQPHQRATDAEMVLSGLGHWSPDRHLTHVHKKPSLFVTGAWHYTFKGHKQSSTKANIGKRGWHTLSSPDAWMCHGRFLLHASTLLDSHIVFASSLHAHHSSCPCTGLIPSGTGTKVYTWFNDLGIPF